MSRVAAKKWADVDEEDEEEAGPLSSTAQAGARFETTPDKDGIKMVIEYVEKDGQTYKVTRKVKVRVTTKRTNQHIAARMTMEKFGKPANEDERTRKSLVIQSEEEVPIELTKKVVQLSTKDDAEDKFHDESLNITEGLFKEKKVWSEMQKDRQSEREHSATVNGTVSAAATAAGAAPEPTAGPKPGAYLPPSLRGKGAGDGKGGKGDGKGGFDPSQEASLRITNLSEDAKEGDLQDLFSQCGRLQRVYLAKDPSTGISRGFAFVTYYNREDAQKAIDKLHGHGYDNLILQVQFAKPKV